MAAQRPRTQLATCCGACGIYVGVITIWGATAPSCGFSVLAQLDENQFLTDPDKYPFLPSSIFGKSTFEGYESAMESLDPKAILERVNQLMLP